MSSPSESSPAQDRTPFIRWMDTFLQEQNIKWILGLGVCILLGSSLRLVTLHWREYTPAWKYLVLLGYTVAVHILGQFSYHRLGLRKTGTVLMSLTVLLIPLNFLSLHWIQPQADREFADSAWNGGLSLLIVLDLIGSALAANRIFVHFLQKPQITFLASYLVLCLAGSIVPGLPSSWSPVVALVLWAVFAVGSVKINRHVFWLMEEHRQPRIFGFFPIALLGAQFATVFLLGVAGHLSVPWVGLVCTLVSLPILLCADAVARVFEQRTGSLVRPIPWSISGPLTLGTLMTIAGVVLSSTGWPTQTQVVPTAIIAAVAFGIVAHRTSKMVFAWGMVAMILVAYQTSPALVKEFVLQLRDQAAVAVNEPRLPYAFYGLTYAPLIAAFSVAAAILSRKGNRLFAIPLQVTATCLSLLLFAASFTHPSATFPVALVLSPMFVVQMVLFRERQYLIPAALVFLAGAYGFPGFAERVMSWPMTSEYRLLLWTAASGLLLAPGVLLDRWARGFRSASDSLLLSPAMDRVCQLFGLVSLIISAGVWTILTLTVRDSSGLNLIYPTATVIGGLLVAHSLRWLVPGLGELTLVFSIYAIQSYLASCPWWGLSPFETVCGALLLQWVMSYLLERYNANRFSRAFGSASYRVSGCGLVGVFSWHVCLWGAAHVGVSLGNWTISTLTMVWALDAARRFSNRSVATIAWSVLLLFATANCSAWIGVEQASTWWLAIWTMVGITLVSFRRLTLTIVHGTSTLSIEPTGIELPSTHRKIVAWVEPIADITPLLFASVAVLSLVFLDWPKRVAGLAAIGCFLIIEPSKLRTSLLTLSWPLLNWQILAGLVGLILGERNVFSLTSADISQIALPLAALASASCFLFEGRFVRERVNSAELIGTHQTLLFVLTACMLCVPVFGSSSIVWSVDNILFAVMAFVGLTASAVGSAVRTQAIERAWHAEFVLGVSVLYFIEVGLLRWHSPELMYGVLVAGLLQTVLAKWTARTTRWAVLTEPLRRTGFWLPAAVVPLALLRNAASIGTDAVGFNSLPLLGASTLYFWRAMERRHVGTMSLSAVILNIAFALLWRNLGWTDPQLFMIPIGISVLVVTELLRNEIPAQYHWRLRMIGSLMILVSPVFDIVKGSWLHILTLMIASTAIALLAIGLRIRTLLYTSTAFLLADLVALIARSSVDEPNILWIAGIVLGAGILVMGAICENNREHLLARIRYLAAELEQWN